MCFAQIPLCSCFSYFELMMLEHKQNILKTALEALGKWHVIALSQRWMLQS